MDNPQVTTEPEAAAWDLAKLKAHLRIHGIDDDAWLEGAAASAVELLEHYLGRAFITRTYTWYRAGFVNGPPAGDDFWFDRVPTGEPRSHLIQLPVLPVNAVNSIKYLHPSETQLTLDADEYRVDLVRGRLNPDTSWPQTAPLTNAVEIEFDAGYGATAADLPPRLRQGLHMLIGHWYENREHTLNFSLQEVPTGLYQAIDGFRGYRF